MRRFVILILSACLLLPSCVTVSQTEVVPIQQPIPLVVETQIEKKEGASPTLEIISEPKSAEDYPRTQDIPGVTATHGVVVEERLLGLEIPSYIDGHPVVAKLGYSLSYNIDYVQADWVAYVLEREDILSESVGRSDKFYEETDVIKGSAHLSDYKRSGYDRGHLISSADRNSSVELNQSTFSLLNMSPQVHRFNAGLFLKAEKAERDAAVQYGILFVVSGPVFSEGMSSIGECDVAVPKEFYKVFLGQNEGGEWHAIALIMPQEYENGNLKPYFVAVDVVEEITGIDFYPSLEDDIEIAVEAEYDTEFWPESFK